MNLIRVSMIRPNSAGIYAPSRVRPEPVTIPDDKFKHYLAVDGLVSFEPDGYSNPVKMTMYGHGLDCWYIEVG